MAGGLDLHLRRRELGEDVHRHGAELPAAEDHHRHGQTDHEEAKLEARSDNPAHHGRGPPRHCNANGFPDDVVVRPPDSVGRDLAARLVLVSLGAEQLGRPDRHDLGAGGWAVAEERLVAFDALDLIASRTKISGSGLV